MLIFERHGLLRWLNCISLAKLTIFPPLLARCSARHGNANRNQNAWNSFGIARKQLQLSLKYPPGFITRKLDCKFSSLHPMSVYVEPRNISSQALPRCALAINRGSSQTKVLFQKKRWHEWVLKVEFLKTKCQVPVFWQTCSLHL